MMTKFQKVARNLSALCPNEWK